jgi:hypothetical protein
MPAHIVAAACRESTKRKKKGRPTLGQPLGQAIQCFRVALAVRGLLLHLPWVSPLAGKITSYPRQIGNDHIYIYIYRCQTIILKKYCFYMYSMKTRSINFAGNNTKFSRTFWVNSKAYRCYICLAHEAKHTVHLLFSIGFS